MPLPALATPPTYTANDVANQHLRQNLVRVNLREIFDVNTRVQQHSYLYF